MNSELLQQKINLLNKQIDLLKQQKKRLQDKLSNSNESNNKREIRVITYRDSIHIIEL